MPEVVGKSNINGLAAGASIVVPVDVTASKTSGVIKSFVNPEATPIIATFCRAHVKTKSVVACTLDIGVAATNVLADNLLDGIDVYVAANTPYDNIKNGGTNGLTCVYVPAGYWFTIAVASGNANGLIADFYFDYQLMSGGQVFTPGV